MNREVAEHAPVDDVHRVVARQLHRDRLEEERNRHAHPDGVGNVQVVRIDSEVLDVLREYEHLAPREIARHHSKLVTIAVRVLELLHHQVPKLPLSLPLEVITDPLFEIRALVDTFLDAQADRLAEYRDPVHPSGVLELRVVQRGHNRPKLIGAMSGCDQGGNDRAGRCPRDIYELVALRLGDRGRANEPDALDATSLENRVALQRPVWHGPLLKSSARRKPPGATPTQTRTPAHQS